VLRELTLREAEARVWRDGERHLVPPSEAQGAAMERLVAAAIDLADRGAAQPHGLGEELVATGFVAELWQVGPTRALALVDDAHRGGGAYFFRVAGAPREARTRRVLQAPHAYHDVDTGSLAARLFFALEQGDAFCTNTLHRYWSPEGEREPRPDAPADVAHRDDTFFQAATRALVAAGDAQVVQLHGFGEHEGLAHEVVLGRGVDDASGPHIAALADALRAAGLSVARFPEDFDGLGGTTNAQGRLCREAGASFVHIETSRALRRRLEADEGLLRALGEAAWGPEP
jgi:hypothetical protein